jgi:hypothetical protein
MSRWSGPLHDMPTRFRIRVGNEQIALPLGVSIIGRDSGCFIAIFDSLISRQHVRIQCDGQQVTVEDLGSRNGTRLNGVSLSGPHAARDGDRIGIGSHELVLDVADTAELALVDMPTGLLSLCPDCRTCYPTDGGACPSCGLTLAEARPTHTRSDDTTRGRWSLGMLVEMLGKAMLTKRSLEAERLMQQAASLVSAHLREQRPLDPDELSALAEAAAWLDKTSPSGAWLSWIASVREQLSSNRAARSEPLGRDSK